MKLGLDFENDKIINLIFKLSYPSIIAMIVNASYNIIDGIYLGQFVGSNALAATTIVMPVQMILMGIGTTGALGAASIISRRLGEKREKIALDVAGVALFSALILGVIMLIIGVLFANQIVALAGAVPEIAPDSKSYFLGIMVGWLYFPMVITSNNLLRTVGNAKAASSVMLIGVLINIIVVPVYLFVFKLGVFGVGLGTSTAQLVSLMLAFYYYKKGKFILPLKIAHFKIKMNYLKEMYIIGFSSFVRQAVGSVMFIVFNKSVFMHGGLVALNAFGIINKINTLITLPIFGLLQGIQPLVGFSYGSRNFERTKEGVYKGILVSLGVTLISLALLLTFRSTIVSWFTAEPAVQAMAEYAMLFIMVTTPLMSIQLVGTTVYQAFGKARMALFLAIVRQVLVAIPLVLILGESLGLLGVWLSFPISDVISATISGIAIILGLRRIKKNWEEENATRK